MIIVYITCESIEQAKKIGKQLLKQRLCGCIDIIPSITSIYYWPPKTNKLSEGAETVLLVKTVEKNFKLIEKEVLKIHSWQTPCIFSLKIDKVNQKYFHWLKEEMNTNMIPALSKQD